MDTLCGVGIPELLILGLLGFIVIGPDRTREVAVMIGRWLGKAMRAPWWKEFQDVSQSLRNLPATLVRMADLEEAQEDIQRTIHGINAETQVGSLDENKDPGRFAASQPGDPWGLGNPQKDTSSAIPTADDAPHDEIEDGGASN